MSLLISSSSLLSPLFAFSFLISFLFYLLSSLSLQFIFSSLSLLSFSPPSSPLFSLTAIFSPISFFSFPASAHSSLSLSPPPPTLSLPPSQPHFLLIWEPFFQILPEPSLLPQVDWLPIQRALLYWNHNTILLPRFPQLCPTSFSRSGFLIPTQASSLTYHISWTYSIGQPQYPESPTALIGQFLSSISDLVHHPYSHPLMVCVTEVPTCSEPWHPHVKMSALEKHYLVGKTT